MRRWIPWLLLPLAAAAPARPSLPPLDALATRLAAMTAVAGYERAVADTVLTLLPGATRDRAGNIVRVLGSGAPRRLIACPLDEPGYVVGGIRPDGYLTLRRAGPNPGPLADQQVEGQRIVVFGRKGPVPGVVGVRSTHLTRGRNTSDAPFTFDDAYVDVGADSAAQAAALGIEVLAPVAREKVPHRYGADLLAAPAAGRRTACAALLRAASASTPVRGQVIVAFVVEQGFTRRGILTIANSTQPLEEVVVLDGGVGSPSPVEAASPDSTAMPAYAIWSLATRYAGTPVETVSLSQAAEFGAALAAWIGGGR